MGNEKLAIRIIVVLGLLNVGQMANNIVLSQNVKTLSTKVATMNYRTGKAVTIIENVAKVELAKNGGDHEMGK